MSTELLSPTERVVYLFLEGEWKLNNRQPFSITAEELADIFNVSRRTIVTVVKKLRDHHIISSVQVNRGSIHSYSLYTLETYLTTDSDDIPNYLDDGSLLLSQEEVDEVFGSCDLSYTDGSLIDEDDVPY